MDERTGKGKTCTSSFGEGIGKRNIKPSVAARKKQEHFVNTPRSGGRVIGGRSIRTSADNRKSLQHKGGGTSKASEKPMGVKLEEEVQILRATKARLNRKHQKKRENLMPADGSRSLTD